MHVREKQENTMLLTSIAADLMAYYTTRSRSASSEKTAIIQGFDPHKITCGAHTGRNGLYPYLNIPSISIEYTFNMCDIYTMNKP
jgi:hypothetical protein